jgi:hypothetical protein
VEDRRARMNGGGDKRCVCPFAGHFFFFLVLALAQTWILHLNIECSCFRSIFVPYSHQPTNTCISGTLARRHPLLLVSTLFTHACIYYLTDPIPAHLYKLSPKYNKDFISVLRNSRSSPRLHQSSNPQNAFPNTHTHRPPRPKTPLTPPHKHISGPRRLPLPL